MNFEFSHGIARAWCRWFYVRVFDCFDYTVLSPCTVRIRWLWICVNYSYMRECDERAYDNWVMMMCLCHISNQIR